MTDFGTLYDYQTENGVVIPQTSSIKSKIVETFNSIFDAEIDTSDETPIGRLIEALTLMFTEMLGVNAQNANSFNPNQAMGAYLDALGNIWGVTRTTGESDYSYRKRILVSQSRGSGYVQSINNAISQVSGVTGVCVLENGYAIPAMRPNSPWGISLDPHSVFICVIGGNDSDIAEAIYAAKSSGCGFTNTTEYGTPVVETVSDGSGNTVTFYRPIPLTISVSVEVTGSHYTGNNIVQDTKDLVKAYFAERNINCRVTTGEIISAIALGGSGIVATDCEMTIDGDTAESFNVRPYQSVTVDDNNITVSIYEND